MIIALGGVLPTRLKFGEGEAEWQTAAGQVLETAVEAAPSAARAELIDQIGSLAEVAPQAASPALSGYAYEELIIQILREGQLPEPTVVRRPELRADIEFDLAIESGTRVVLIDVKFSPERAAQHIPSFAGKVRQYRERTSQRAVGLLVTRSPLPESGIKKLKASANLSYVVVSGSWDADRLFHVITEELTSDGSTRP
jgi:hypothetical protein